MAQTNWREIKPRATRVVGREALLLILFHRSLEDRSLNRVRASFTGSNSNDFGKVGDEYFSIAHLSGLCFSNNGINYTS